MSEKFQNKYRIDSSRLKDYDYSQEGAYFITLCTENMESLLGEIRNEEFFGSQFASIVKELWLDLTNHYDNCELDEFIIMPNHIHGMIIILTQENDETIRELSLQKRRRNMLIPKIIGRFKMTSTKRINEIRNSPGKPFWQAGYYDRIIRTQSELENIQQYIAENPLRWDLEKNHVENLKM